MEDIMSDIGTTPSLEPVTDENIMDLISSASALRQQSQRQDGAQNSSMEMGRDTSASFESQNVPNRSLKCAFCALVFDSYPALVEHRSMHGGSRPYECHMCEKRFTQKAHLIIHRRTHTGERPYACHICHKRFSQTSHLNSHKRVHSGDKPFLCSLCNMGFCRRQRLEAHLQQQHANDLQRSAADSSGLGNEELPAGYHGAGDTAAALLSQMVGGVNTKDLLLSVGLSSVLSAAMANAAAERRESELNMANNEAEVMEKDDREEEEDGDGNNDSDTGPQVSVFPGFSMDDDDDVDTAVQDTNAKEKQAEGAGADDPCEKGDDCEGSGRESRSPTPTSAQWSLNNSQSVATKSRRKPTFVRKLGGHGALKLEHTEDGDESSSAEVHAEDNSNGGSSLSMDQTAQQAAMKAVLWMAARGNSGSDAAGESVDASAITSFFLKQSLLAAAAIAAASRGRGGEVQTSSSSFNAAASQYGKSNSVSSSGMPIAESATTSLRASLSSANRLATPSTVSGLSPLIRHNSRVSLLDFAAADLVLHLMSRDDAFRCDFCRVVFQDAAMYHLHRSQHDKMDIRKCNLCGHLSIDRFDFTAHFMSVHK